MINFPIIKIPEKYWLNVENFNFRSFNYDDIRCLYNSPRCLIDDFENIKGFIEYSQYIMKKRKFRK